MIEKSDSLKWLQSKKDYTYDISYGDQPYALGSEIYIRPDGKPDYRKAVDFMEKWEMPTGDYWEKWFIESFRTLKHGGYLVMFGIDRQLLMFEYYAVLAGFHVRQSMYWYFISSFPKSSDLAKNIDKNAKVVREVHGTVKGMGKQNPEFGGQKQGRAENYIKPEYNLTYATSELAQKYDGYRYSIAPLKQTCETIMVFQKPYKTGSCLHDTLAYEKGDETCACFAWNIDGGRVPISISDKEMLDAKSSKNANGNYKEKSYQKYGDYAINNAKPANELGRYPSQTFCDSNTADILDNQSGLSTSTGGRIGNKNGALSNLGETGFSTDFVKGDGGFGDIGGCSKILHKCDFQKAEMDLYLYEPKVSKKERNAGLEEGENTHPTVKPIALNYRVLTLFKTPNPQKIAFPFAGVYSEVIGGYKAGFTDFEGCDINSKFIETGNKRLEYWKEIPLDSQGKPLNKTKHQGKNKRNEQLQFPI